MRSSTGRWVSGPDFFGREAELRQLDAMVRERNHVLLTGPRRMGKTSIVRELGRRLEGDDWLFLFVDLEGAGSPEDAVADMAQAVYAHADIARRFASRAGRWFRHRFEEAGAAGFRFRVRAGLDPGSWRRHGQRLFRECGRHDRSVFLALDELPIFLKRMLKQDGDSKRVDQFLSWLRGVLLSMGDGAPVLLVSGSIGLEPLLRKIGLPDRINHLYSVRLPPWDRDTSVACLERLADSHGLELENGVAAAVYETLGIGVPHHVQGFFARLRDHARMHGRGNVALADVRTVYRNDVLGPSGQADLMHWETRLRDALDDGTFGLAMEILAETATQETFTPSARSRLIALYSGVVDDPEARVAEALDVLIHDGYVTAAADGYRFQLHLLRDWLVARFGDHHVPIEGRAGTDPPSGASP